jgi:hypothetical protein
VPLIVIQRQLGHTNLGITSIYLQGIDNTEIIDTVHAAGPRPDRQPGTRGRAGEGGSAACGYLGTLVLLDSRAYAWPLALCVGR